VFTVPLAGSPVLFKPPPVTAQDTAFDAVQLSVDELMPLVTLDGFAVNDWIVAGGTAINWVVAVTAKPSTLLQVSVYVVVAVIGPAITLPAVATVPFNGPPATAQDAPLDSIQVRVDKPMPLVMLEGFAPKDWISGRGTAVTWVIAVAATPSELVQVSVYVVVTVTAPVLTLPLARTPFKAPPVARQDAPVDSVQLKVDEPPLVTLEGLAPNDWICGGETTVTVLVTPWLPRIPVQVSVYLVVAAMLAIVWLPLSLLRPLQPSPDLPSVAWQEVAFWLLQVSIVEAPG